MKKKALIVSGGWEGHMPMETAAIMAADLQAADFEVEVAVTLEALADAVRLTTFDLIIPHWTMGRLAEEQESNLVRVIESGVGLGGIHGGMGDAFRSNALYQFAVGGQFVAHPDNHTDYEVNIVRKDDPVVAGLSDFKIHSEQYYLHVDPSNEVLATTTFQTISAPWINGTVMPVVWKRRHGRGRVFYSSIGHDTREFATPQVREITRRGLIWAAR